MKLQIEKMIYEGSGLAHDTDGAAIYVPLTLPGETVDVRLLGGSLQTGNAELVALLDASPDRIEPRCPHFGTCGGCQYQHAAYAAQVQVKLGILRETLAMAGLFSLPEPQVHTAEPWEYRNRIRLRVDTVDGALRVGYNRRGSHEMLPILVCPIAAPLLMRAAEAALKVATESRDLLQWTKQLVEIELFADSDQSRLQMTVFLRAERGVSFASFCEQIKAMVPQLMGAGVVIVGASGHKEQPGSRWAADGLTYRALDRDYWVSRGSFFQVNRFLVDTLLRLVVSGRSGKLAWDLYAGVGLFSRALAASFAAVIGVETIVGDLTAVLKGNAVASTTANFLRSAVLQRDRPDLIVMDPPRAGVGAEVCALLSRVKAPEMVYVSCDPVTLARDLRAMVDSGYTVTEVHFVDLFPQTVHMETVVVLNR